MEKKLWYHLKTFNFTFQEIGPQVDYYGPVTPYLGVIEQLEKEVSDNSAGLWSYLLDGLEEEHWPEFTRPQRKADDASHTAFPDHASYAIPITPGTLTSQHNATANF
jgi:hypothetical protein